LIAKEKSDDKCNLSSGDLRWISCRDSIVGSIFFIESGDRVADIAWVCRPIKIYLEHRENLNNCNSAINLLISRIL